MGRRMGAKVRDACSNASGLPGAMPGFLSCVAYRCTVVPITLPSRAFLQPLMLACWLPLPAADGDWDEALGFVGGFEAFGGWGGWSGRGRGGFGRGRGRGRGRQALQRGPKGVGYGGSEGWHGGSPQSNKRQAAAAKQQESVDAAAGDLLQRLRDRLCTWAGGLAVARIPWLHRRDACLSCGAATDGYLLPLPPLQAAAAQEQLEPLPLPLLGALRGGPLAPLLRLLLHNDRCGTADPGAALL